MTTLLTAAAVDWGFIWTVTIIGFFLVVAMLILLVFIMKLFGVIFATKPKKVEQPTAQPKKSSNEAIAIISEEEVAAITTAFKLYTTALHDREMEVITIHRVKSAYSPWNSKIHGLTQMPEYKGKN